MRLTPWLSMFSKSPARRNLNSVKTKRRSVIDKLEWLEDRLLLTTFTVDDDAAADFSSIQQAVNAAVAGDVIIVHAGTYNESVDVTKSLTIQGANAGISAGFDGGVRGAESIVNGAIDIYPGAVDTTIDGFRITGALFNGGGYHGVRINASANNVTVANNQIYGNDVLSNTQGIEAGAGLGSQVFQNNEIKGFASGVYVNPGSNVQVLGNYIHHVYAAVGNDAVTLEVKYNRIENAVEGVGLGGSSSITVQSNSFDFATVTNLIAHYSGTNTVNATGNWWGSTDDSAIAGKMLSNGVAGTSKVDFSPYLTTSTDNSATAGFQGDFSQIGVSTLSPGAANALQEGIDSVVAGSTIKLSPGTYGGVTVNKNLSLVGVSPANTIIDGVAGAGITFDVGATAATLQNLKIAGNPNALANTGGVTVTQNGVILINYGATETTVEGGSGNDTVQVRNNGGVIEVQINGGGWAAVPNNKPLVLTGGAGDDNLVLDFTNGSPIPAGGLSFDGGTGGNDSLTFTGNSLANATLTHTNANDGSIVLDGRTLTYEGLDPILINTPGANWVLEYTSDPAPVTLANVAGDLQVTRNGVAEQVTISPAGLTSLTIRTGAGADTIEFDSLPALWSAGITIDGQGDAGDVINFDTSDITTLGALTLQNIETAKLHRNITAASLTGTATIVNVDDNPTGQIQDGVSIAATGATINVAAGTFNEGVSVTKTLTINGAQAGVDARTRVAVPETIVSNADGDFQIRADNVVIDGFTLTGVVNDPNVTPLTSFGTAIWMNPGGTSTNGGAQILNNIITGNISGIELDNNGVIQTVVQQNLIQNNNQPGSGSGNGIQVNFGLANALIDSNTITNHTSRAMFLAIAGSGITVSNNVTDRQIYIASSSSAVISGNQITNAASSGIMLGGGNTSTSITNNEISSTGIGSSALRFRQDIGPNSGVSITNNKLLASAGAIALRFAPSTHTGTLTIAGNQISGGSATIENTDAGLAINASGNYWGTSSSASVAASLTGIGAGNIDFTPLLDNNESLANTAVVGFQPDFSSVTVHTLGTQTTGGRITEGYDLLAATGTVNVQTGSYTENVDLGAGGNKAVTLAAGASPGQVVITGNLTLTSNDILPIDLDGAAASLYDSFQVSGTVNLNGDAGTGATLSPTLTFPPTAGTEFTIIDKTSAGAISGTFNGIVESHVYLLGGFEFQATYLGGLGDNNNFVLKYIDPANPILNGTPGADNIVVQLDGLGTEIETYIGGLLIDSRPLASVTTLVINGLDGSDNLTIDYTNGDPVPSGGLTYIGGAGVSDTLTIDGSGPFGTLDYDATGVGAGTLTIDGGADIDFTGLEPVVVLPVVGVVTINIDPTSIFAGAVTATFTDAGAGTNLVSFSGGLESMTFANPSVELVVNGDNVDDDNIIFTSLNAGFDSELTVNGNGGATDVITLNTALTLGSLTATGDVTFNAETINLGANISTDSGPNSGNVSLTASTINLTTGVTIDTNNAVGTDGTLSVSGPVLGAAQVLTLDVGPLNDITLNNVANNFGTVTVTSGRNVLLRDTNGIILGGAAASGTFGVTAGGTITQTGALGATTLTTSSVGGTNLSTSTNTVTGFNATNTISGAISLVNSTTTLTVTGISQLGTAAGSDVSVTNTGNLTTSTAVISTTATADGNITLQATAGVLTIGASGVTAGDAGTVGLTSTVAGNDVLVQGTVSSGSGQITVNSDGAITESGAGKFGTTGLLSTSSVTGQTLNGANTVGSFNATNSTSGNIQLTNTAATLIVTGISETGGGITVSNTGNLNATGAITDNTALQAISLTATSGDLTIGGGVTGTTTDTISLNTLTSGNIFVNSAVSTGSGTIDITSVDNVDLTAGVSTTGAITITGDDVNSDAGGTISTGTLVTVTNTGVASTLTGVISGAGGLTKLGTGTVVLPVANTYAGQTNVNNGTLAVTANTALGTTAGNTVVAAAGTLDVRNTNYATLEALSLNGGTLQTSTGTSVWTGTVDLAASSTVDVATNAQLTISGQITGAGASSMTKTSGGVLFLTNANNTYDGVTNISAGTLFVTGNNNGAGAVNANGSSILGGTGSITGDVNINATAHLAPGVNGPGRLTIVNSLTFATTAFFDVDLNGLTAGTQYDQVRVTTGAVDLGGANGATMTPTLTFGAVPYDRFTIIDKQSAGAVTPYFEAHPEGSIYDVGARLRVSYIEFHNPGSSPSTPIFYGDGNDVSLTVMTPPILVTQDVQGNLTLDGTGWNDDLTLSFTGTNQLTLIGNDVTNFTGPLTTNVQLAGPYTVTGNITIKLGNGKDKVLIRGVGPGAAVYDSGNLTIDLGSDDDAVTTIDNALVPIISSGLRMTGSLSILGGAGLDNVTLGSLAPTDTLTALNVSVDTGTGAGDQTISLDRLTANGNVTLANGGAGNQTVAIGGTAVGVPNSILGNLIINQLASASSYTVGVHNTSVGGFVAITNGNGSGAAAVTIDTTVAAPQTIFGSTTITNGNNLSNAVTLFGFAGGLRLRGNVTVKNGAGTNSNNITVTDIVNSGTTASSFTNGGSLANAITFNGVAGTTFNSFLGLVSATNGASNGTNVINATRLSSAKGINLTNGSATTSNTVAVGGAAALDTVEVTGNLVIANGTAGTTTIGIDRLETQGPVNSGNVTITNAATGLGGTGITLGAIEANSISGNLQITNQTSTGTRAVTIDNTTVSGRSGVNIYEVGAGDTSLTVGDNQAVMIARGLTVQDGSGASSVALLNLTVGSLTYTDLGGGTDTLDLADSEGVLRVNGVTRIDTGLGSDIVRIATTGTATLNDTVFIALGSGNDLLFIGTHANSPAFNGASKFMFDGGTGTDIFNASPLSIAEYTGNPLGKKVKSKIKNFETLLINP